MYPLDQLLVFGGAQDWASKGHIWKGGEGLQRIIIDVTIFLIKSPELPMFVCGRAPLCVEYGCASRVPSRSLSVHRMVEIHDVYRSL